MKGSEGSLKAAGRQYAELEFLESRFTFTACPVPTWGAGHNNSVSVWVLFCWKEIS